MITGLCCYLVCFDAIVSSLRSLENDETLLIQSGKPVGIFRSHIDAPRVLIANSNLVGKWANWEHFEKLKSDGLMMYGQMTAGSYMYIGPQGIVHGTTITVMNAARMIQSGDASKPRIFVTAGLGGMSGAQPKAGNISECITICAEVNIKAIETRHSQNWVDEIVNDTSELVVRVKTAQENKEIVSIAYHGNIVDVWESFYENNIMVDIGSDQTSLHNPWSGGYYPIGYSFEEANKLIYENPEKFKTEVKSTLKKHVEIINKHVKKGTYFFDYGNAFLLEASKADADIVKDDGSFKYPSYVQDIMGPMCFDYGFGPFRWVCASNDSKDLETSDKIAFDVLSKLLLSSPKEIKLQMQDNINWIKDAKDNKLVVGSQARILYADSVGRIEIALAFNKAIREKVISQPIILGRDHHDVSGTDSPYRETSNIYDGSQFTADMAIQNVIGDSFRGATWVSIHNGGGVGWGEVINGGFGMMIDGSKEADEKIKNMLFWDVNNGIARRNWARNKEANFAIKEAMKLNKKLDVFLPNITDENLLDNTKL